MAREESYTKIIAHSLKNQLPNSSHSNYAHHLQRSCVIASRGSGHGSYGYECGDRSRLLVVLRWCSGILDKIVNAYLSSPILMAVVPLVVGIGLGVFLSLHYLGGDGGPKRKLFGNDLIHANGKRGSWSIVTFAIVAIYHIHGFINWLGFGSPISSSRGESQEEIDMIELKQGEGHGSEIEDEDERDAHTRKYLRSNVHTKRDSGLDLSEVPKHIAVIMDGNRRYGKAKYGSITKGHWDGSKTLLDFSKWCLAEGVKIITVYAFSTENWNRSASEVSVLMGIFCKYCEELREEALERGIRIKVLSTETEKIPSDVAAGIQRMVEDTKHCDNLTLNICLSYGSKGEILNACKAIAHDVNNGVIKPSEITNSTFESKLLTGGCPDPDLIIRTSGEFRLSNFMLWQLAYSEMFFLDKQWPELTKGDLINVLKDYAKNRQRRFGK